MMAVNPATERRPIESQWPNCWEIVVKVVWAAAGVAERSAVPMWTVVERMRIGGRGLLLGELGSIKCVGMISLTVGLVLVRRRLTGMALPRRILR